MNRNSTQNKHNLESLRLVQFRLKVMVTLGKIADLGRWVQLLFSTLG